MDDLFGDLVPAKPVPVQVQEDVRANGGTNASPQERIQTVPSGDDAHVGGVMLTISKDDLEQLLSMSVQAAVDLTFGKFAKSLRNVLEDMSKRIEAQEKSQTLICSELKETLKAQGELLARQAESSNARFTTLDMAIREVDRGLQAMRDKQELQEAQVLLAKFSAAGSSKVAAEQPQAPAATPVTAPVPAPSPAAVAPAPAAASPVVASAPAPALPMPATAPFSAAPPRQLPSPGLHAAMPASAPAVQYQDAYQQQGPPQHMQQQPAGPELQYAAAPQPAYAYRAPDGGMQPVQTHQMGGGEQYHHMMPPPQQQQQQQQQQHQQQQQLQQPLHMAPNYSQPQFPPMQQQMQQQVPRPAPVQAMQGPIPPDMAPHMPGLSPSASSMYPASRMPNYPSLGPQRAPSYQQPMPPVGQAGPAPQPKTTSRAVPLEQIITDITNMGFERHQVMALVSTLQKSGQAVDLNMIIDKLTRGDFH